jgi:manganese transport protein
MTPAFVVILLGFNVTQVLVTSQVILSFGIAFALIPLLLLTSHRKAMGALVNTRLTQMVGWICLAVVLALNAMVVIPGF